MKTKCRLALRDPRTWWIASACWFTLLWFLSEQSSREIPAPGIPHLDKLAHFAYFAAGGILFGTAVAITPGFPPSRRFVATLLLLALIGALDEWHQTTTPGREGGDFYDWLADFAGSALGAASSSAVYRRFAGSRSPDDLASHP